MLQLGDTPQKMIVCPVEGRENEKKDRAWLEAEDKKGIKVDDKELFDIGDIGAALVDNEKEQEESGEKSNDGTEAAWDGDERGSLEHVLKAFQLLKEKFNVNFCVIWA
jgi:hypothetical protein